jgi:type II secretory pathway pseudopilin PulG
MRPFRRRLARAGFTILEILIAIVVLVLGITGIIALFPTAIESGNKTVEDSYAAAITQSVVDALTVGIRESRYPTRQGATTFRYFIFNHDGVVDQAPLTPGSFDAAAQSNGQGALWRRDFTIILPTATVAGGNTDALKEPNFIYPVPTYLDPVAMQDDSQRDGDPGLNQRKGNKLSSLALTDNLDVGFQRNASTGGALVPWISRVYHLGRYRTPPQGQTLPVPPGSTTPMLAGDIRMEYLGESVTISGNQQQAVAVDPYPSYGFAFTLQRARIDTAGGGTGGTQPDGRITSTGTNPDQYSDSLYTLRVMIFKNFDEAAAHPLRPKNGNPTDPPFEDGATVPRSNVRIREFVTLIAL